jgi:HEAT repeat protein
MENNYIWPEAVIEELIAHSNPEVQEWAVSTLFSLYPESALVRMRSLLKDNRGTVVRTALKHLPDEVQTELLPVLKRLYLEGSPDASSLAIRALGKWKIPEAVHWMEERILEATPLAPEQVDAMVSALGSIPTEASYNLLKKTETAVQQKESSRWEIFYASLLQHRRSEDAETLILIFLNRDESEKRRRAALGILLKRIDPGFNPSDVYFGNLSGVSAHMLRRIEDLEGEGASLPASQSLPLRLDELKQAVSDLQQASTREIIEKLKFLGEQTQDVTVNFEQSIFRMVSDHLVGSISLQSGLTSHPGEPASSLNDPASPPAIDEQHTLACLALLALTSSVISLYGADSPEHAGWKEKLADLLKDRYPKPYDSEYQKTIPAEAPHPELASLLQAAVEKEYIGLGTLRAIEMMGRIRAVKSAPAILRTVSDVHSAVYLNEAEKALLAMGPGVVPALLSALDAASPVATDFALRVLSQRPTPEAVQAVAARLPQYLEVSPERALDVARKMAAPDFLPILEAEYRPGEWALGSVYAHICHVQNMNPPRLREIERDVQQGREYRERHRKVLEGDVSQWPSSIDLELACKACGKRYHYQVSDIHLHPHNTAHEEGKAADLTPYRNGVVIGDDLQCKNCERVNEMELTPAAVAQITTESLKLLAYNRSKLPIPQHYPLKHVQIGEKEGKPLTLLDVEADHLTAIGKDPTKSQRHIALGKFYEYVKVFPEAKKAYFKALDMDADALEASAGLARLFYAEGKLQEAYDWIESCYQNLSKGRIYLAVYPRDFKKAVREKRRELARELGIRPQDESVEIRFKIESPDYPKNKPCPCGSGKKYKLCCMPASEA